MSSEGPIPPRIDTARQSANARKDYIAAVDRLIESYLRGRAASACWDDVIRERKILDKRLTKPRKAKA